MGVLQRHREMIAAGHLEPDPEQMAASLRLAGLTGAVERWRPGRGWWLSRLIGAPDQTPRGLYIFGRVGGGKTMLMDLFFDAVRFSPKRRIHFHEFMAEAHERIASARKTVDGDPIPHVARELATAAKLLCFDELHVTDIADAMILGRLFKGLLAQRVVVVATSNIAPTNLYKGGLNRQLFLPFIDLIEDHMDVVEVQSAKDFRLDKLAGRRLYLAPDDAAARAELDRLWNTLTGAAPEQPTALVVKGRRVAVPRAAMGVARFGFADLCEQPLGALDYLQIAHAYHTLILEGVPMLGPARRNEARRFITLIDTLYDNRVCLIVSAEAEPGALYPAGDGADLFRRTASRLIEMRSEAYLADRASRGTVLANLVDL